jgi:urease subunit alpha
MLAEPVRTGPQLAAVGGAPARTSVAFMAAAAMSADLPITRTRAPVSGCRELTAADMVRNTRTGTISVDPVRRTVSLDGEVVTSGPAGRVAYSGRYLF